MPSLSIHRDIPIPIPSKDIICLGAGVGADAGVGFEHRECLTDRLPRGGTRDMFKSKPHRPYTWSSCI